MALPAGVASLRYGVCWSSDNKLKVFVGPNAPSACLVMNDGSLVLCIYPLYTNLPMDFRQPLRTTRPRYDVAPVPACLVWNIRLD